MVRTHTHHMWNYLWWYDSPTCYWLWWCKPNGVGVGGGSGTVFSSARSSTILKVKVIFMSPACPSQEPFLQPFHAQAEYVACTTTTRQSATFYLVAVSCALTTMHVCRSDVVT